MTNPDKTMGEDANSKGRQEAGKRPPLWKRWHKQTFLTRGFFEVESIVAVVEFASNRFSKWPREGEKPKALVDSMPFAASCNRTEEEDENVRKGCETQRTRMSAKARHPQRVAEDLSPHRVCQGPEHHLSMSFPVGDPI